MRFLSIHHRKIRKAETTWTRMDLLRFRDTRIFIRSFRRFVSRDILHVLAFLRLESVGRGARLPP